MNDELDRLRDVARALVAESQAWAAYTGHIIDRMAKGMTPAEAGDREAHRLALASNGRTRELDQAMARLAETNPELVAGYKPKWKPPPPL
jgi:hypothetical protein